MRYYGVEGEHVIPRDVKFVVLENGVYRFDFNNATNAAAGLSGYLTLFDGRTTP
jgi:hypothetical protein